MSGDTIYLDGEGIIIQDVNSNLFTAIINHLRLKALLPASEVPPIVECKQDRPAPANLLAYRCEYFPDVSILFENDERPLNTLDKFKV